MGKGLTSLAIWSLGSFHYISPPGYWCRLPLNLERKRVRKHTKKNGVNHQSVYICHSSTFFEKICVLPFPTKLGVVFGDWATSSHCIVSPFPGYKISILKTTTQCRLVKVQNLPSLKLGGARVKGALESSNMCASEGNVNFPPTPTQHLA